MPVTTSTGGGCGTPSKSWTFGAYRAWANCKGPGKKWGDQFWTWVLSNVSGPFPAPKLSDRNYGDASFASVLQGHDNTATGWFGAWLLIANVGPELAKDLADAIGKGAGLTAAAPGAVAAAIPNPFGGLAAIGDFFGRLTQANTWIRAGEILIGIVLLGVGFARASGTQNAVASIVKARIP